MISCLCKSCSRNKREKSGSNFAKEFPLIIYVMGTGRSGSTILDIMLASNPNICGVGELTHIYRDSLIKDLSCGCGDSKSDCVFWGPVLEGLNFGNHEIEDAIRLSRAIESHIRFWLLFLRLVRKEKIKKYYALNKTVYEFIQHVSGRSIIVDSSKYAGRALALLKGFPGKIRVICLTRSPEGVMSSFQKKGKEQPEKGRATVLLYYVYVLLCCRIVFGKFRDTVLLVSYEKLTNDPIGTIERISRWCDVSLADTINRLEQNMPFPVGHIVTGNRIRKRREISFKAESATGFSDKRFGTRVAIGIMKLCRFVLGFKEM